MYVKKKNRLASEKRRPCFFSKSLSRAIFCFAQKSQPRSTKILISCVLKVTEQSGVSLEIPNCPCFFWRVPPFLKVTQQYGFFADFKPLSNIVFFAIFAQKVNVISIVGDTPRGVSERSHSFTTKTKSRSYCFAVELHENRSASRLEKKQGCRFSDASLFCSYSTISIPPFYRIHFGQFALFCWKSEHPGGCLLLQ